MGKIQSDNACEAFLKQRISIIDKYDIFDGDDQVMYHVAGNVTGLKFEITNTEGESVASIARKIALTKDCNISFINGDSIQIKKKLMAIKEEYNGLYNDQELQIKGNLTAFDFDIIVGGELVGTVDKKLAAITDTYRITAADAKWMDAVVALAVAIDSAVHK